MQISIPISSLRTNSFGENGGTLNSPLILSRDPQENLEAATKQYIDNKLTSVSADSIVNGILTANRFPNLTGDISSVAGSGVLNLSNTGVSPGSYAKVTVTNKGRVTSAGGLTPTDIPNLEWNKITTGKPTTLGGYGISNGLSKLGGEVSGYIKSMVSPTQTMHAVNKSYVTSIYDAAAAIATGTIVKRPSSITPYGFLKVNGAKLDKIEYSALYAVIGDQYTFELLPGAGRPWTQQYLINTEQSTDITGWTTGTSLPGPVYNSCAVVTKNRVYLISAYNSTVVFTAPINSDGTLGTWTTATPLPSFLGQAQGIVIKNILYLIDGSNGSNVTSTVYKTIINTDGTLGSWVSETNVPVHRFAAQAIITKNRVYLLGGTVGNEVYSTVQSAPINADGSLGVWSTSTNSLPSGIVDFNTVVTKDRVYVIGGRNVQGNVSTVYTAPINADGTLGVWSTSSPLPSIFSASQAVVTKNKVYLLGGWISGAFTSTCYVASINPDGTLGTWVNSTSNLSTPLGFSQAIVTNSRVYLLGGLDFGGNPVSTVISAPISGGLNDYSPYYNGSITPTEPGKFSLPDYTAQSTNGSYFYIKS